MHNEINNEEVNIVIDVLRIPEIERCHVYLRQLDARDHSGDKYIILDLPSESAFQSVLRQVN